jgi:hypothetical protein
MEIDLKNDTIMQHVVALLYYVEGDLEVPDQVAIDVDPLLVQRAKEYLSTLSHEQFETFCAGDIEDTLRMVTAGGANAEAAHELVDHFYMELFG